jgi:hypothetical protein
MKTLTAPLALAAVFTVPMFGQELPTTDTIESRLGELELIPRRHGQEALRRSRLPACVSDRHLSPALHLDGAGQRARAGGREMKASFSLGGSDSPAVVTNPLFNEVLG